MLRFEQQQRDGVLILALQGSLDAVSAAELKNEVVAIADAHHLRIVADLSALRLIDSTGVGVLISLFKRTRAQNGRVLFSGLTAQPKEVFRLLRLDRSLDLFPTVDDAVKELSKG